jgi:hypothetical protein
MRQSAFYFHGACKIKLALSKDERSGDEALQLIAVDAEGQTIAVNVHFVDHANIDMDDLITPKTRTPSD